MCTVRSINPSCNFCTFHKHESLLLNHVLVILLIGILLLLMLCYAGHSDSVICVGFNHDSTLLATCDMAGKIKIWNLETKSMELKLETSDICVGNAYLTLFSMFFVFSFINLIIFCLSLVDVLA